MSPKQPGAQASLLEPDDDAFRDAMRFEKTFRIAVSGDVLLTNLELRIVDTADFQRLRNVRQLGTVNFVFPTALHTRFDHSLGTLSMAERMLSAIMNNTSSADDERHVTTLDRILTRLYALLHDVAHVPFGHTIEDELRLYERHDENPARLYRFLGPQSDIGQLITATLGHTAYDRFMAIYLWDENADVRAKRLASSKWEPLRQWLEMKFDDVYIHDIVSNTVCADLLDYLQRDNYFCNLGVSLEYRFLNFLYIHVPEETETKSRRVFVRLWKGRKNKPRRDTLTDLARLLETRYMVAERAYFHHAKLITGAMLGRALQEAGSSGELTEEMLYDHSDDSLLRALRQSKVKLAAMLGGRLFRRQLFKMIEVFDQAVFQEAQQSDHEIKFRDQALAVLSDPKERRSFEDEIAEKIDVDPGTILIYSPPTKMNLKPARMNVRWKGVDTELRNIDDPVTGPRLKEILDAHELLWGVWLIGAAHLTPDQKVTFPFAGFDRAVMEEFNGFADHFMYREIRF